MVLHIIRQVGEICYDDDPCYLELTLYRRGLEHEIDEPLPDR